MNETWDPRFEKHLSSGNYAGPRGGSKRQSRGPSDKMRPLRHHRGCSSQTILRSLRWSLIDLSVFSR